MASGPERRVKVASKMMWAVERQFSVSQTGLAASSDNALRLDHLDDPGGEEMGLPSGPSCDEVLVHDDILNRRTRHHRQWHRHAGCCGR